MSKYRLDLSRLSVDSFDTSTVRSIFPRGVVFAHSELPADPTSEQGPPACSNEQCGYNTQGPSCGPENDPCGGNTYTCTYDDTCVNTVCQGPSCDCNP